MADALDDESLSLNMVLRDGVEPRFSSDKPCLIVLPIRTWHLPDVAVELIGRACFECSRKIHFVATMEEDTGNADRQCRRIAEGLGLELCGFTGTRMPRVCAAFSDPR